MTVVGGTRALAAALAATVGLGGFVGSACGGGAAGPAGADATSETGARTAAAEALPSGSDTAVEPAPAVIFATSTGAVRVEVEVAATDDARRKGLMFRDALAPGKGMLFLMGVDKVQSFWMRNTLIPLDMIFVDGSMRVVGVVADAEPQTETPRFVAAPSRYVVEVPGGWAERVGIATGDAVRFERVEGAAP